LGDLGEFQLAAENKIDSIERRARCKNWERGHCLPEEGGLSLKISKGKGFAGPPWKVGRDERKKKSTWSV